MSLASNPAGEPPFIATCTGRQCYHSRRCYVVTRSRGQFRAVSESDVAALELTECEICADGNDWDSTHERTTTCPHCGRECTNLGRHIPCDGGDSDESP